MELEFGSGMYQDSSQIDMLPSQNCSPGPIGRSAVTAAGASVTCRASQRAHCVDPTDRMPQELDFIGQWSTLNHSPLPGTSTA